MRFGNMISNTQQKVGAKYPFWDEARFLDFEEELVQSLEYADTEVLLQALEYLGWDKLVTAYRKLEE